MHIPIEDGESSIVSSVTAHNEMLNPSSELVEILYEPFYRNRQKEIPPGLDPCYKLAIYHIYEGYFSASVGPTYIGSAYRLHKVPEMTDVRREAISKLQ